MNAVPTPEAASDVAALSYEQARDELVKVVAELEQGNASLEQSLQLWERRRGWMPRGWGRRRSRRVATSSR
jgi:hypothetical protein